MSTVFTLLDIIYIGGEILEWIVEMMKKGIWNFIADLVADILSNSFELVIELILKLNDVSKYIDVYKYVHYVQAIAGGFVVLAIGWEIFKQVSGGMLPTREKSIGTYVLQIVWSIAMIFFLPYSVEHFFLKLNNLLIKLILYIGIDIDANNFRTIIGAPDIVGLGGTLILMWLIMAVALFFLGIVGGIRYIELLIAIVISPLVAVSYVRNGEAVEVWVRETVSIVFTQALHVFLLQIMFSVMGKTKGLMMLLLSTAIIYISIKGATVLRRFIYSTGVGSATVSAIGQAGRLHAMKFVLKGA